MDVSYCAAYNKISTEFSPHSYFLNWLKTWKVLNDLISTYFRQFTWIGLVWGCPKSLVLFRAIQRMRYPVLTSRVLSVFTNFSCLKLTCLLKAFLSWSGIVETSSIFVKAVSKSIFASPYRPISKWHFPRRSKSKYSFFASCH